MLGVSEVDVRLVDGVEQGRIDVVRAALAQGGHPDARKSVTVVARLSDADWEEVSDTRWMESALGLAVRDGRADLVEALLEGGADPNLPIVFCLPNWFPKPNDPRPWNRVTWDLRWAPDTHRRFGSALELALTSGRLRFNLSGGSVVVRNPEESWDSVRVLIPLKPSVDVVQTLLKRGAKITEEAISTARKRSDRTFSDLLDAYARANVGGLLGGKDPGAGAFPPPSGFSTTPGGRLTGAGGVSTTSKRQSIFGAKALAGWDAPPLDMAPLTTSTPADRTSRVFGFPSTPSLASLRFATSSSTLSTTLDTTTFPPPSATFPRRRPQAPSPPPPFLASPPSSPTAANPQQSAVVFEPNALPTPHRPPSAPPEPIERTPAVGSQSAPPSMRAEVAEPPTPKDSQILKEPQTQKDPPTPREPQTPKEPQMPKDLVGSKEKDRDRDRDRDRKDRSRASSEAPRARSRGRPPSAYESDVSEATTLRSARPSTPSHKSLDRPKKRRDVGDDESVHRRSKHRERHTPRPPTPPGAHHTRRPPTPPGAHHTRNGSDVSLPEGEQTPPLPPVRTGERTKGRNKTAAGEHDESRSGRSRSRASKAPSEISDMTERRSDGGSRERDSGNRKKGRRARSTSIVRSPSPTSSAGGGRGSEATAAAPSTDGWTTPVQDPPPLNPYLDSSVDPVTPPNPRRPPPDAVLQPTLKAHRRAASGGANRAPESNGSRDFGDTDSERAAPFEDAESDATPGILMGGRREQRRGVVQPQNRLSKHEWLDPVREKGALSSSLSNGVSNHRRSTSGSGILGEGDSGSRSRPQSQYSETVPRSRPPSQYSAEPPLAIQQFASTPQLSSGTIYNSGVTPPLSAQPQDRGRPFLSNRSSTAPAEQLASNDTRSHSRASRPHSLAIPRHSKHHSLSPSRTPGNTPGASPSLRPTHLPRNSVTSVGTSHSARHSEMPYSDSFEDGSRRDAAGFGDEEGSDREDSQRRGPDPAPRDFDGLGPTTPRLLAPPRGRSPATVGSSRNHSPSGASAPSSVALSQASWGTGPGSPHLTSTPAFPPTNASSTSNLSSIAPGRRRQTTGTSNLRGEPTRPDEGELIDEVNIQVLRVEEDARAKAARIAVLEDRLLELNREYEKNARLILSLRAQLEEDGYGGSRGDVEQWGQSQQWRPNGRDIPSKRYSTLTIETGNASLPTVWSEDGNKKRNRMSVAERERKGRAR
ncbi:hypothetical protein M427DRAFT_141369 [Gonapodya prolifera JEL478]|uniref:Uncharacterized protein n=1 Tax=Gonapodya prolifera (strain JEL478) TaxID=1344416 RepID=A0A138ZXF1_GONPJ|nr:hypothetical protein M427DRAFT_141369 [Gonapodya prolifera JEL478]|eukprot:KXS09121.1 hypothetical protein M427DRAFT_141369 [Gonapodya prolifera JEL478]